MCNVNVLIAQKEKTEVVLSMASASKGLKAREQAWVIHHSLIRMCSLVRMCSLIRMCSLGVSLRWCTRSCLYLCVRVRISTHMHACARCAACMALCCLTGRHTGGGEGELERHAAALGAGRDPTTRASQAANSSEDVECKALGPMANVAREQRLPPTPTCNISTNGAADEECSTLQGVVELG
jgi:hypothetical protein